MSRRPDPIRIETARRAATIARLISGGHPPAMATALVAEWERDRSGVGQPTGRADWEAFDTWLAGRGRQPSDDGRPP